MTEVGSAPRPPARVFVPRTQPPAPTWRWSSSSSRSPASAGGGRSQQMRGMDNGPWTALGTFGWFIGVWVVMMAAMMFPSVAPTVALYARMSRNAAGAHGVRHRLPGHLDRRRSRRLPGRACSHGQPHPTWVGRRGPHPDGSNTRSWRPSTS